MKAKTSNKQSDSVHGSFSFSSKGKNGESFFPSLEGTKSSFFGPSAIQPKLEVGQPDDKYEREAERVADTVMGMPDTQIQRQPMEEEEEELQMKRENTLIQRKCRGCEEEEKLQKKHISNTQSNRVDVASSELSSQLKSNSGRGSRLPEGVQAEMSRKIGADFSGVNIHTDSNAVRMNKRLNAQAFTYGNDIYFNRGEYNPNSRVSKHLLAHELTHIVQQLGNNYIQRFSNAEFNASNCETHTSRQALTQDFERSDDYGQHAYQELGKDPLPDEVADALRWYFHGEPDYIKDVVRDRVLGTWMAVYLAFKSGDVNCPPNCRSNVLAFVYAGGVQPDSYNPVDINLCPAYFRKSVSWRAAILLHEAAHLTGMSVTTDDVYDHTNRFRHLTTDQALLNADSYALFINALQTGIPLDVRGDIGIGGGVAEGRGGVGWYSQLYLGMDFQHPVLHVFNPSLRLSFNLIGYPEQGEETGEESAQTPVMSTGILPGLRLQNPRPSGGTWYFSLYGGPSFFFNESGPTVGAEVGTSAGYRWSWGDIGVGAQYMHNPEAPRGNENILQIGPKINLTL